MKIQYFYLIRHKCSGKFYAGSKYARLQFIHPDQFWNGEWSGPGLAYYTSSKEIEKIRLTEGDEAFEVCFISHRPNNDAREFEAAFLKAIDAARDGDWFNKTNGDGKLKNDYCSEETKQRMSESRIGKKFTNESKLKMRMSKLGKSNSEEHNEKIKLSRLGKHHSIETKAKMSKAHLERSEETKDKISAALKGKAHETVKCPHCGKTGGKPNMVRYHFDKCKYYQNLSHV